MTTSNKMATSGETPYGFSEVHSGGEADEGIHGSHQNQSNGGAKQFSAEGDGSDNIAGFRLVVVYVVFAMVILAIGKAMSRFLSRCLGHQISAVTRSNMSNTSDGGETQTGLDVETAGSKASTTTTDHRRSTIMEYFKQSGNQLTVTKENIMAEHSCDASSNPENAVDILDIEQAAGAEEDCELALAFPEGHPRFKGEELGNGEEGSNDASSSGTCAICLNDYREGEVIVWSHDKACLHMFHRECFVEYLMVSRADKPSSCPMCRRTFCGESFSVLVEQHNEGSADVVTPTEVNIVTEGTTATGYESSAGTSSLSDEDSEESNG